MTTATVKHLKNKLSSLENEKIMVEKINIELIRRYDEQGSVAGRSVGKLIKMIPVMLGFRCAPAGIFRKDIF